MNRSPQNQDKVIETEKTPLSAQLLHDLRSPLNQIIGYSEMLVEAAAPQADDVEDLNRIRTAGHRLLSIIEENFTGLDASSKTERFETEEPAEIAVTANPAISPGLVLVVDDDALNRDVLTRRLERQGHRVVTAVNGMDALSALREQSFDVVLLDIMMPDMDGYEVLGRIKEDEQLNPIPVIMISALSEVQSVVRCLEAGAADYLTKPFNPTLLRARIDSCLEKKRGRDRETLLFEQLQQNYRKLQELEKLRDDMRNMIVHDLRTPLTAVIVGVQMLEKHGELNPEQREMMAIAVSGGKTLLGMINELLDVEKLESGTTQLNYETLSAAKLIAGAVEQVTSLAEEGSLMLMVEVEPGLPSFSGDESKLSRALVNLIANAIKFTPAGWVKISASSAQDEILFAVRDTGEGIPQESFDRIFEKFGQLDAPNRAGTGLGLAFCKLAVEAHGGRIRVESTPGQGSTFSFTIPLLREGQPAPRDPQSA